MSRSICVRLLIWYAAVLTAVVVGFAFLLYYEVRDARLSEVDAQLESATATLDATLRLFPKFELTGEPPPQRDRDFPPGQGPGFGDRPPPGERMRPPPGERAFERQGPLAGRERLFIELQLPRLANPNEGATSFAVWRQDGEILKAQDFNTSRQKPDPRTRSFSQTVGAHRERITLGPMGTVILVSRSVEKVYKELASLRWNLLLTGSLLLVIGLVGGWFISRRIFRPIATITKTASRISADNLSERINTTRVEKELVELSTVLNATFDRLENAFDRQTQFTADASHELRTPLAVIRSQVDLTLSKPREPEDYKNALEVCRKSALRMQDLVEKLLMLARVDAGWAGLTRVPVPLEKVFAEAVEQFRALAKEKRITVHAHFSPVKVAGDAMALGQVAANLIANAIQYSPEGTGIRIDLEKDDTTATFTVTDSGPGIPEESLPKLFERFYRVDKARSRVVGGTGLGLAIVHGIITAHHGSIDVMSKLGEGTTFVVRLPVIKKDAPNEPVT